MDGSYWWRRVVTMDKGGGPTDNNPRETLQLVNHSSPQSMGATATHCNQQDRSTLHTSSWSINFNNQPADHLKTAAHVASTSD